VVGRDCPPAPPYACAYMRVCVYACMCICVYVYMRVCVYACMCTCVYDVRVCVYACMAGDHSAGKLHMGNVHGIAGHVTRIVTRR
jgi:hypothetical protein